MKKINILLALVIALFSLQQMLVAKSTSLVVQQETQKLLNVINSNKGPQIYQLPVADARKVLEDVQSGDVSKITTNIQDREITIKSGRKVTLTIVKPNNSNKVLPVVLYYHGGGWILGSKNTHDRLIKELSVGAEVTVVFVNFTPAPEANNTTILDEAYGTLEWVHKNASLINVNANKIAVAGDSVGGNMATVVSLMAKENNGPHINLQVLFYPVTNANFKNDTYRLYGKGGYFLTTKAMEWFWNAYATKEERKSHLITPLNSTLQQLSGLPEALVITAEHDVLREEGEAYASKLMQAGVKVTATRYLGTMHDFVMLNPLAKTPAALAATQQAVNTIKNSLHSK